MMDAANPRVSAIIITGSARGGEGASWARCLRSILDQDCSVAELLVVAQPGCTAIDVGSIADDRLRLITGDFATLASAIGAGVGASSGAHILLIDGSAGMVVLCRSALSTMVMAATRRSGAAMVYADYDRVDDTGVITPIHLLDHHLGRLRETTDLGPQWLCRAEWLRREGAIDDRYDAAALYDLRLRLSERGDVVHIANAHDGSLCTVYAPANEHDVFDYLRDDRAAQREYERALTEHLSRIGAHLAPGWHVGTIHYTADEAARFVDCVASVVIPVHHRPEFIGSAIESVQRQSLRSVEAIVVVNGGASDPTGDEVRRYLPEGDRFDPEAPRVRLLVVDVNNIGMCINHALRVARGKYYVQLDSDDRLKRDAIEKLLAVFESDATIGMVIGSYEVWNLDTDTGEVDRDVSIPVVTHEEWTEDNGRNNLLRINGAGAPRAAHIKAIQSVGWFGVNDTGYGRNYGEDYDLVLRMSERYRIGRVWEPIYEVIRHPGGTDHTIDQATRDRNDEAKDAMRQEAILRRQRLNRIDDAAKV